MNYKLGTGAGNTFSSVSEKAKQIAIDRSVTVEFEFNGVTCLVDKDTNLDWLSRDYCNSWTMDWKTVGANCVEQYDEATQKELTKRQEQQRIKEEQQQREYKIKEDKEREEFNKKVAGVEMEFKDKDAWEIGLANNKDAYGACVYEYAEGWAKLMQVEMKKYNDTNFNSFAERTSFELGFLGITGFMYGAAVSVLSQCWKYGEELRKWHNKEYKHEGEGVVNPAILTISA